MTRDEIEKMMLEAGLTLDAYDSKSAAFLYPQIERFAHLVAKHTQEQCAKVCEEVQNKSDKWGPMASYCAAAIRSMTV